MDFHDYLLLYDYISIFWYLNFLRICMYVFVNKIIYHMLGEGPGS